MKILGGDLIKMAEDGKFDVIIHGCNCFNTMGAGIARTIATKYPQAYHADCATINADKSKLGNYTCSLSNGFGIVNAYTQYSFGGGRSVNYEAISRVFARIKKDFTGMRIGYPMIGAGLGGGNWKIISCIIDEELRGEDHTLVIFPESK